MSEKRDTIDLKKLFGEQKVEDYFYYSKLPGFLIIEKKYLDELNVLVEVVIKDKETCKFYKGQYQHYYNDHIGIKNSIFVEVFPVNTIKYE